MIDEGMFLGVEEYWAGGWHGRSVFRVREGLLYPVGGDQLVTDVELPGTLFPRLTDHHVHVGLVDAEQIMPGGITAVVDLGWVPRLAAEWHTESGFPGSPLPEVRIAGGLLTCEGGYPVNAGWAPAGAAVELRGPADADAAVRAQIALGASVIKVTVNSDEGPVPSPELLTAIVTAARAHGVPVAAHVQGDGMTRRALDAGVNVLAHTPFTEVLDSDIVARLSRAGTAVVSTLDIHGWGSPTDEYENALVNLTRIAAAGGRVRYGTDLGNGPLPVGINPRELAALADAGLDREALVASIAGTWQPSSIGPRLAWVPGSPPETAAETAEWLSGARASTIDYLEETLV
ncbi:hypothetical protein WDJ51_02875 [Rathayibacter sp. YIM 133350]|uniref:amidohydrolase family protein n=1 Tax=Rathayibacter sp. YIM 133350 TaxID=3131992 RepID=UPI00307FB12F